MFQTIKERNLQKEYLKIIGEIVTFYLYVIVLFLIGFTYFNFPSNGVEGPGNEFVPFFRMFFMVFIIMIPFIGVLTFIGYSWNEHTSNLSSTIYRINKVIPFFLIWIVFWPGLYFVIGYFDNILGLIFDNSASLSPYWNVYWLLFLVLGRITDQIQLRYLERTKNVELIKRNKILQFIVYFLIDVVIILFTLFVQVIAFMFSFVPAIPFLFIIENFNFTFPWPLGMIPGLILLINWPVFSCTAYIACLLLRGRIRRMFDLLKFN